VEVEVEARPSEDVDFCVFGDLGIWRSISALSVFGYLFRSAATDSKRLYRSLKCTVCRSNISTS
jgi:hypothetical protein